jgi:hypothetical protein
MPAQAMYKDNFPIGMPIPTVNLNLAQGNTIETEISKTENSRPICDDSNFEIVCGISLEDLMDVSLVFQADM